MATNGCLLFKQQQKANNTVTTAKWRLKTIENVSEMWRKKVFWVNRNAFLPRSKTRFRSLAEVDDGVGQHFHLNGKDYIIVWIIVWPIVARCFRCLLDTATNLFRYFDKTMANWRDCCCCRHQRTLTIVAFGHILRSSQFLFPLNSGDKW